MLFLSEVITSRNYFDKVRIFQTSNECKLFLLLLSQPARDNVLLPNMDFLNVPHDTFIWLQHYTYLARLCSAFLIIPLIWDRTNTDKTDKATVGSSHSISFKSLSYPLTLTANHEVPPRQPERPGYRPKVSQGRGAGRPGQPGTPGRDWSDRTDWSPWPRFS